MEVLYLATAGSADPVRASIPLHLAVNGSVEVGHAVRVVLAGDATELVKPSIRDTIEGMGVPPARELFAKLRQHDVPVFV
jgi:predicted peroxiredoxin